MVLETGIILTVASVAAEMIIISKAPTVKNVLQKSSLGSLGFSTGISWLVGFLFEATGLTVLLSALLSTIISWCIYRGLSLIKIVVDKNKLVLSAS